MARGNGEALEALKRLHIPADQPSTRTTWADAVPSHIHDPPVVPFGDAGGLIDPSSTDDHARADPQVAECPDSRTGRARRRAQGVEANARLTGTTAGVLLLLLAAEGLTVLRVRALLTPHVFIGMLLVPPVVLKIGSTGWRFTRYYLGSAPYRRKGPPPPLLRLLGPMVVVLTVTILASGIALLLAPVSTRAQLLLLHKASFVLWFAVMVGHVVGHVRETARLVPRDIVRRTRHQVRGAGLRQWLVASSLAVGLVLGIVVVPRVGPWLQTGTLWHR